MKNKSILLSISKTFILLICIFTLNPSIDLYSQKDITNKGKDFWITFLPNYHNYKYSTPEIETDSLYIFINAEKQTQGTISYSDINGIVQTENFNILDPSQIYIFKVKYNNYELLGINDSGEPFQQNQCEKTAKQSFHVVSNEDITVYAHSQAVTTSDAFMVLPYEGLGQEYYVMSYNSDDKLGSANSSTPSQFAIVASFDATQIDILPSAPTYINGSQKQTITLNRGEVYLVQAKVDNQNHNYDLTGSRVVSNKPIAVFGGQQRATIPVALSSQSPSRDVIIEQMPPVSTWGRNAFLVPPKEPVTGSFLKGTLYRILAAYDSTKLFIDGVEYVINSGKFYEQQLTKSTVVSSNSPILAAVFKYSAGNSTNQGMGDPFMMLIPPKEQFLKKCRVNNVQAWEDRNGTGTLSKVYFEQYVTIVAPDDGISSVKIDNQIVNANTFTSIPSTGYSYSNLPVLDGVHNIESDKEIGVYIYGYGFANSYGYIGGMGFKQINSQPPGIQSSSVCYDMTGYAFVQGDTLKNISRLFYNTDSLKNVTVDVKQINQTKKSIDFEAKLINKRKDGHFDLTAVDSDSLMTFNKFDIFGFTFSVPGYEGGDSIPTYSVNVKENQTTCFNIPIIYYGKGNDVLASAEFNNLTKEFKVTKFNNTSTFSYGIKDSITVCIKVDSLGKYSDTLFISNGKCGKFPLAIIRAGQSKCDFTSFDFPEFKDRSKLILNGRTYISDQKYIRLTDNDQYRSGALWYYEPVSVNKGFSTEFKFRFSEGNNYQCDDKSLPGADGIAFVIQNAGPSALGYAGGGIGYEGIYNSLAVEFDTYSNDSTQIENYFDPNGNHVSIQSNGKNKNSSKHLPIYTKGINKTILPLKADGTIYFVKIDYNLIPNTFVVYLDTTKNFKEPVLTVSNIQLDSLLKLNDEAKAFIGLTAATGCAVENHDILSWSYCPVTGGSPTDVNDNNLKSDGVNIYPNPSKGDVNIEIDLANDKSVNLSVYDLIGNRIYQLNNSELKQGRYLFNLNELNLNQGSYFIKSKIGNIESVHLINIIR